MSEVRLGQYRMLLYTSRFVLPWKLMHAPSFQLAFLSGNLALLVLLVNEFVRVLHLAPRWFGVGLLVRQVSWKIIHYTTHHSKQAQKTQVHLTNKALQTGTHWITATQTENVTNWEKYIPKSKSRTAAMNRIVWGAGQRWLLMVMQFIYYMRWHHALFAMHNRDASNFQIYD